MDRLRLPGSWRARLNLLAAACAAAAVAGGFGLRLTRGNIGWPFLHLYWTWFAFGVAGAGLRALAFGLERCGTLEFTGWAEEEQLRARRLLTVRGAKEPVRGCGLPEEPDDTPVHVKLFTAAAILAWCVALPTGNMTELPVETRFWFLWAAVVPTAAAAFFYAVHRTRGALRLVREASEDYAHGP